MNPTDNISALTLTMLGEARGEREAGMIGVGNVVMNRVRKQSWFGLTPLEVCLKHSNSGTYQFSCWNKFDPNRGFLLSLRETDGLYQRALGLAKGLVAGTIPDNTEDATHYYSGSETPFWALGKTPCVKIGGLLFFNNVN